MQIPRLFYAIGAGGALNAPHVVEWPVGRALIGTFAYSNRIRTKLRLYCILPHGPWRLRVSDPLAPGAGRSCIGMPVVVFRSAV
jgi:hypothetical protein